jgi:hypothetical protein
MFGRYVTDLHTRHPVCLPDHNCIYIQCQSYTTMLKLVVQATIVGSGREPSADLIRFGS